MGETYIRDVHGTGRTSQALSRGSPSSYSAPSFLTMSHPAPFPVPASAHTPFALCAGVPVFLSLNSHKAAGSRPGRSEAAAAGEGMHPHTGCLSPSSQGPAPLGARGGVMRTGLWYLPAQTPPPPRVTHLSQSCSGWCGHTSGRPPPHSPR